MQYLASEKSIIGYLETCCRTLALGWTAAVNHMWGDNFDNYEAICQEAKVVRPY
jgi:hypothetical protein